MNLIITYSIIAWSQQTGQPGFLVLIILSIPPSARKMNAMLMQTGWIQASLRVTKRLAQDPTCLSLRVSFPMRKQAVFQGFELQWK